MLTAASLMIISADALRNDERGEWKKKQMRLSPTRSEWYTREILTGAWNEPTDRFLIGRFWFLGTCATEERIINLRGFASVWTNMFRAMSRNAAIPIIFWIFIWNPKSQIIICVWYKRNFDFNIKYSSQDQILNCFNYLEAWLYFVSSWANVILITLWHIGKNT